MLQHFDASTGYKLLYSSLRRLTRSQGPTCHICCITSESHDDKYCVVCGNEFNEWSTIHTAIDTMRIRESLLTELRLTLNPR
jgi:hypothetical protein